jgi:hypothetical protein
VRVHAVQCMLHSCVHCLGAMGWLVWFSVSRLRRRQRLEAAAGGRCRESGAGWLGSMRRGEAGPVQVCLLLGLGAANPPFCPVLRSFPQMARTTRGRCLSAPASCQTSCLRLT